jgi:hypothetical protein
VRKLVWTAGVLAGCLALHGCGGGGGDGGTGGGGGGGGTIGFATQVQPLFNAYCIVCHTAGGSADFMPLTSGVSYGNLVNVASTMTVGGGLRVAPSDPTNSVLWKRVSGSGLDASDAQMPPGFALPGADQITIQSWIGQGALDN